MLRREITGMAKDCGMDSDGIADVRLAVTEAATNAVIRAYAKAEGELKVTAAMQDGELAIVIGDTGPGLAERRDSPGPGGRPLRHRKRRRAPEDRQPLGRRRDSYGVPMSERRLIGLLQMFDREPATDDASR
jgi:hypothetical protein